MPTLQRQLLSNFVCHLLDYWGFSVFAYEGSLTRQWNG